MFRNMLILLSVVILSGLSSSAVAEGIIPGSTDNGDGTYTFVFQPSGGLNNGTDTGGATDGKDAGVLEAYPNSLIYYEQQSIIGTWNSNCNNWHAWAYFQFNLTGLPEASEVVNVDFKYYLRISRGYGWPYQLLVSTFDIYRVTSQWQENTLTWNTKPTSAGVIEGSANVYNTSSVSPFFEGFVETDITNLYKGWKDGTYQNHGFYVKRRQQICENANGTFINSSDNTNVSLRPALKIVYLGAPPDTTAPVITPAITGTLGNDGWYTSDVTVSWSVVDEESEVTSVTGGETTVITQDTSGVTLTCEATSDGGTNSVSVTVKRDATAPVITILTPADGDEYITGEVISADWNASDAMSGVANTSAGTIDTSTAGEKSFTVTAIDAAGNESVASRNYYVLSVSEAIDQLIAKVKSLNLDRRGTENSLLVKLYAAKASLERGQENTAANQINAFINEVRAQSGKKVALSDADDLISRAARMIAVIQ